MSSYWILNFSFLFFRYDNRCRSLSAEQIEENLGLDKPYAIRLKIDEPFLSADDMLYDRIKINSCYEGDPVLLKSDGYVNQFFLSFSSGTAKL